MKSKHFVILVPGLGDKTNGLKIVTRLWPKHGLSPILFSVGWRDGKKFQSKLNKLVNLVDKLSQEGIVYLIGTSAGGSAVLNAFMKRKNIIHRVINICGRVRTGPLTGFRSFASKTTTSPAFAESIKLFEAREPLLTKADRRKIMTIRPMFGDELVPSETTNISGATNLTIPSSIHTLSIALSLTLFSKKLSSSLKVKLSTNFFGDNYQNIL